MASMKERGGTHCTRSGAGMPVPGSGFRVPGCRGAEGRGLSDRATGTRTRAEAACYFSEAVRGGVRGMYRL